MKKDEQIKEAFIKANMPDVVKDFAGDCKWQFYMPSGGYAFQKDFSEFWVPYINGKIEEMAADRAMSSCAAAKFADIHRGIADARNALIAAREYFENNTDVKVKAIESTGSASEFFEKDFAWLETAAEKAHGIWTAMSSVGDYKADNSEINLNISFLVSLRDFFLFDRQFDILMWMKGLVDSKYRTKINRVCFKLAKEQMARLAQIQNCNTVLAVSLRDVTFARPIQSLGFGTRSAFDALKEAKRRGISETGSMGDDVLRKNLHDMQENAQWDIVRP